MKWARRVKPGLINHLYNYARLGIYHDELLLEVGWGLYARCKSIATVTDAVNKGEIPCPQCGETVYRPVKRAQYLEKKARAASHVEHSFNCPNCSRELTWSDCKDALIRNPRCFTCQQPLELSYSDDKLRCNYCGREWLRLDYRRSVVRRKWLPCPYCGKKIRRPAETTSRKTVDSASAGSSTPNYPCPKCGNLSGVHTRGKFHCLQCGYEQAWKAYRKRSERLKCSACGYEFTWNSWRQHYRGENLLIGNTPAVEQFLSRWPECNTPQKQLTQIDTLLHALHDRGAIAPAFLAASADKIKEFLDRLASQ